MFVFVEFQPMFGYMLISRLHAAHNGLFNPSQLSSVYYNLFLDFIWWLLSLLIHSTLSPSSLSFTRFQPTRCVLRNSSIFIFIKSIFALPFFPFHFIRLCSQLCHYYHHYEQTRRMRELMNENSNNKNYIITMRKDTRVLNWAKAKGLFTSKFDSRESL